MSIANALNDPYVTGSFTPNLVIGVSNTGITYSTQTCLWQLVGNMFFFTINLVFTSKGSNTGQVTIVNMPYTADNTYPGLIQMYASNMALSGGYSYFITSSVGGQSALVIGQVGSNNDISLITNANLNNNTELYITGQYLVV